MRKLWRRTRLGGCEREDDRHRRRRGSSGAASPGMGEPTGTPVSVCPSRPPLRRFGDRGSDSVDVAGQSRRELLFG
jgi:hypothetical protein